MKKTYITGTDVTHGIYVCITGRRRKAFKVDNPVQAAGAARGHGVSSRIRTATQFNPELRLRLARGYPNQTPSGVNLQCTKSAA
jgi:hypothetical protein